MKKYDRILGKAERFIDSATLLAEHNDYDSAASRLYYAMFYIAEALLDAQGLSFASHRGVVAAFGKNFAKTGALDERFHKALLTGFSQRQIGDYRFDSDLGQEDIDRMRKDALDFLVAAKDWLKAAGE